MTSPPPGVHPTEPLTAPDGTAVDVDVELVPLVRAVWAGGWVTAGSCQDLGDAADALRALGDRAPAHATEAFAAFYRGYAWLKMPRPDALAFLDALAATPFRDRVTARWGPEAWRVDVAVRHDGDRGFTLAPTAHLHFPRTQIPELTAVATALRDGMPR
ncbi:hypothetical protein GCM10009678_21640 [Actinomadura kijaniata]|uniref:Uncharacterized protein n=1 Tax=Actinomadura namibiensis TaxID=182080 RepID=A0A7W3LJ75_ACTNM|nr:hypothetical protein [Actinomadura namibiensis]MBA8949146.1 hypothetical protein [Actinomadura namibiensis]